MEEVTNKYQYLSKPIKYSEFFKRMIVEEVEKGLLNKDQIKRKYQIGGKSTVLNWCRKYGRKNNQNMKNSSIQQTIKNDRLSELENENQQLREKVLALETLIEVADNMYNINIKKNVGFYL